MDAQQENRSNNYASSGTIPANSPTNFTYVGIFHSREVIPSYLHDPRQLHNLEQLEGPEAAICSMVNHLEPSTPVPSRPNSHKEQTSEVIRYSSDQATYHGLDLSYVARHCSTITNARITQIIGSQGENYYVPSDTFL
jgi:hypothetical protein